MTSIKIDDLSIKQKISFMKIDVQGYDLKILKGAEKTIKKNKMPIIIEYSEEFEAVLIINLLIFRNF